jgi:hypothetical protein
VNIKSLLYASLARSKLMYGMEFVRMSKKTLKNELSSLEANTLKKAYGLNRLSKSTGLLYAMNINPLELYIFKRKLYFILQLLMNTATSEFLRLGVHISLSDTFSSIGIKNEYLMLGPQRYTGSCLLTLF